MLEDRICPVCGEHYDALTEFCLNDGMKLEVAQTLIGRILHDRYRIDGLIGQGGMGVVYRATHIELEDKFAIKVLNPELISNESAIRRFRQEARAARVIKHPNAVGVTDFGVTVDNLVYLVMEFVDGRPLRELMREGVLRYHRAVNFLCQMCEAIEVAHQHKIIHRDLKPENIMVQGEGYRELIKVLDFGIAKLLEEDPVHPQRGALTKAGTIVGTPQYMSPEQCRNRELKPASDIYAIGVIGYEMLSGTTPFVGNGPSDYFVKHVYETPVNLSEVAPQTPEIIAREIMKALEKDPAARHSSAAEMARCLRKAVRRADGGRTTDPTTITLTEDHDEALTTSEWSTEPTTQFAQLDISSSPHSVPGLRKTQLIDESRRTHEPQPFKTPAAPHELRPHSAEHRKKSRFTLIAVITATALLLGVVIYWLLSSQPFRDNRPVMISDVFGEMMLVRGGKFTMGRNDGETDESPARQLEVKDFYLDKYEVTNQQYKKFVETGHPAPSNWVNQSYAPDEATLPVTHVSWQDAADYAGWAGKRLPTEQEWEYAARGGEKNWLYPWGNEWKEGYANTRRQDRKRPAPVQSFEQDRSPFGVFGLAGNVSEWVHDFYSDRYDLQPGSLLKVFRGGNFVDLPRTSTYRFNDFATPPAETEARRKYEITTLPKVGFRCAKS
jgi:serine/threonine-protein kinase